jgi:negative regulator of genetic competence, sporulation and motility
MGISAKQVHRESMRDMDATMPMDDARTKDATGHGSPEHSKAVQAAQAAVNAAESALRSYEPQYRTAVSKYKQLQDAVEVAFRALYRLD